MKKKLLSLVLSTAMIAALLAGCGSDAASSEAPAETTEAAEGAADTAEAPAAEAAPAGEEDKVIKIGVVAPMTGGKAVYGEGAQNAIDMAVEEINAAGGEYTVEIVNGGKAADDGGDAKQAVNAYNSLIPYSP